MGKILSVVIILILVFILVSLGKQIIDALSIDSRLDQIADEVSSLQFKNRQLEEKLKIVQQYDFIETVLRNELNLGKKNETVIIIPDEEIEKIISLHQPSPEPKIPNWQGWLKLFSIK